MPAGWSWEGTIPGTTHPVPGIVPSAVQCRMSCRAVVPLGHAHMTVLGHAKEILGVDNAHRETDVYWRLTYTGDLRILETYVYWSLVLVAGVWYWLREPGTGCGSLVARSSCSLNEEPDTNKQLAAVSGGGIEACGSW